MHMVDGLPRPATARKRSEDNLHLHSSAPLGADGGIRLFMGRQPVYQRANLILAQYALERRHSVASVMDDSRDFFRSARRPDLLQIRAHLSFQIGSMADEAVLLIDRRRVYGSGRRRSLFRGRSLIRAGPLLVRGSASSQSDDEGCREDHYGHFFEHRFIHLIFMPRIPLAYPLVVSSCIYHFPSN